MTRRRSCQVNFGSFAPRIKSLGNYRFEQILEQFRLVVPYFVQSVGDRPRDGSHVCKRISSRFRSAIPAQVLTIRLTDLRSTVRALDCLDANPREAVWTGLRRRRNGRA